MPEGIYYMSEEDFGNLLGCCQENWVEKVTDNNTELQIE